MLTLVTLVALLSGALGFAWAAQWLIDGPSGAASGAWSPRCA